jgi:methyl-accepting chemotaxis protein
MIFKNNSRKISSLVIDSNAQLRFAQPFAILILAIFATINFIFWQIFSERNALSSSAPPEVLATLNGIMGQLVLMCSLGMVLIGLLGLVLWIVYSHRIFGPQVKIRRQIANLMKGDYDYKISLRKNDEFKDLADDLNRLAEHLKLQTKA